MVKRSETSDERIVYGFHCSWWGGIEEAGQHHTKTPGLPGCPVCGNGLMQIDSAEEWWKMVDIKGQTVPGYRDLISWMKGKCFVGSDGRGFMYAVAAYNANAATRPGRVRIVFPEKKP